MFFFLLTAENNGFIQMQQENIFISFYPSRVLFVKRPYLLGVNVMITTTLEVARTPCTFLLMNINFTLFFVLLF